MRSRNEFRLRGSALRGLRHQPAPEIRMRSCRPLNGVQWRAQIRVDPPAPWASYRTEAEEGIAS